MTDSLNFDDLARMTPWAPGVDRYRLLVDYSSSILFVLAEPGPVVVEVSRAVTDLLGYVAEELIGRRAVELVHPDDRGILPAALDAMRGGDLAEFEARLTRAQGGHIWTSVRLRPVTGLAGKRAVVGEARDIERERAARLDLATSERQFRLALTSAPSGMAVVDLDRRFLAVNPALCRMIGHDSAWLLAHHVTDILDPADAVLDEQMRARILAGDLTSSTREAHLLCADGTRLWADHSIGLLRDDSSAPVQYVSQFVNVTEAKLSQEELRVLANHDPLTSLVNRRELLRRADSVLTHAPRTGTNVGFLFVDIDELKPINDSHGHAAGDVVITEVGRRITAQVRTDDVVARFGGDEFVVMLPGAHTIENAEAVAAKIHDAMRTPIDIGERVSVTVSIGLALAAPGDDADRVVQLADAALYEAKRAGRARSATNPTMPDRRDL